MFFGHMPTKLKDIQYSTPFTSCVTEDSCSIIIVTEGFNLDSIVKEYSSILSKVQPRGRFSLACPGLKCDSGLYHRLY